MKPATFDDIIHLLLHILLASQVNYASLKGPCTETTCWNGGVCVDDVVRSSSSSSSSSSSCICDMTSFTGYRCNLDSDSFTFGPEGGLITVTMEADQIQDSIQDRVAFGIVTTQSDASIIHVDGKMFAVYNLGSVNHPIGDLVTKVNDGQYHVIRFYRNGANSSIQIDDLEEQTKHPQGLFWNGLHILQMAAGGNSRTFIEGDVAFSKMAMVTSYMRNCSDPSCLQAEEEEDGTKTIPSSSPSTDVTRSSDVGEMETDKMNDLGGNASASLILAQSIDSLPPSKGNNKSLLATAGNKTGKHKTTSGTLLGFSWAWSAGILGLALSGASVCFGCTCWMARRIRWAGGRDRGSYEVDELSDRVTCRCKHQDHRKNAFHFSAFKSSTPDQNATGTTDSGGSAGEKAKKKKRARDQSGAGSKQKSKNNKEWYV